MNSTYLHNNTLLRLITLFVLMSFSLASFSHAVHSDNVDSQQVESLDCKLCQHNLDDNNNELTVHEEFTVQFFVTSPLKSSLLGYHQFYIIPALRAPPVN
jgi:hypothetical protein